ncbi:MAG: J domain-containing protein [Lentisphaerae bacterium]|nr:J domain-containing protein [Lentisphaerota bacterium]MCP4102993.1 J domain-containing protein [Lentisphaerota bacterium]
MEHDCSFADIKRAYFKRSKECHPDLYRNSPVKTEEFKQLVEAFDILSDFSKRQRYDLKFKSEEERLSAGITPCDEIIMDSQSDDVLEELIVGNERPGNTTLARLFMDLEKTEVLMTFREGKNLFFCKRYRQAKSFLINAVTMSPHNIVYRVYLARALAVLRECKLAKYHYRKALATGHSREPSQQLKRVSYELDMVNRKHHPF